MYPYLVWTVLRQAHTILSILQQCLPLSLSCCTTTAQNLSKFHSDTSPHFLHNVVMCHRQVMDATKHVYLECLLLAIHKTTYSSICSYQYFVYLGGKIKPSNGKIIGHLKFGMYWSTYKHACGIKTDDLCQLLICQLILRAPLTPLVELYLLVRVRLVGSS